MPSPAFRRSRIAAYKTTPTRITAGKKAGIASNNPWCARYATCAVVMVCVYPAVAGTPSNLRLRWPHQPASGELAGLTVLASAA
ncbi:hypothetical protein MSIMFI_04836 [Mycobacterium simulans]|nr:hypothetical protein MSIMFI_04836 [Mycobacterium simulans]